MWRHYPLALDNGVPRRRDSGDVGRQMHGCQELQLGKQYRDVTSIETTHLVLEAISPRLNKCSNIVQYKVQRRIEGRL